MNKTVLQSFLAVTSALLLLLAPLSHGASYDYVPYKIDLQEGVSQTGAQTYSIPLRMPSGTAPAVLEKRGNNGWELQNIGRDYLGSITHVLDENGTVLGEYSNDAWGRLRDPETLEPYAPGTEPELRLGRGFTAHEHLPWFGLINMNARLYDPLLCRFLSPDPYVQAPDFTQSFNRYSYALNNPLAYSDPNGELVWWVVPVVMAAVFAVGNTVANAVAGNIRSGWEGAGDTLKYFTQGALVGGLLGLTWQIAPALPKIGKLVHSAMAIYTGAQLTVGAASMISGACQGGDAFRNSMRMFLGNFYVDENNFGKGVWQGWARHTISKWQNLIGYSYSYFRLSIGQADRIDYFGGATFITNEKHIKQDGVTLGDFVNVNLRKTIDKPFRDYFLSSSLYMHEYGHAVDSRNMGLFYLPVIAIPSGISAAVNESDEHNHFWTETHANASAATYFEYNFGIKWESYVDAKGKRFIVSNPL